jgi:hypothetical protein
MKTQLSYLIIILYLTGCKAKPALDHTASDLPYDTAQVAILTPEDAPWTFQDATIRPAELTPRDLEITDSLFVACVNGYNPDNGFKIDLAARNYQRQLIAVQNPSGEKEIWVNCFCDPDKDWKTKVVFVHDGGSCYFNFKINLTTKKLYEISVNGEG